MMLWDITGVCCEVVGLIEWFETGVAAKEEARSVLVLDASDGRLGWWWVLLLVPLPLMLRWGLPLVGDTTEDDEGMDASATTASPPLALAAPRVVRKEPCAPTGGWRAGERPSSGEGGSRGRTWRVSIRAVVVKVVCGLNRRHW